MTPPKNEKVIHTKEIFKILRYFMRLGFSAFKEMFFDCSVIILFTAE